ncbi:MAG: peptidoglycan glycosyltransferase [Clostridia bacterium]|nr:peptidoglycan glycosyltransferase [Clostridia bacterium]
MFIITRFFYVQVIWGIDLQKKAIDQWTRNIPVLAKRGDIVDRNGVILSTTKESYTIFVRKRAVTDLDKVVEVLGDIFSLEKDKLKEKIKTTSVSEIKVAKHVDKEKVVQLEKYNLDGVYYADDVTRYYPYDELLCQTLGYTSQDGNGISGLELYYDKYLQGINGEILYESDLTGNDLQGAKPYYIPATDGLNLRLSIDYEMQEILESATELAMKEYTPKSCSVILMDPNNGEILAMSQKPSFNLNEVPYNDIDLLNKLGRNTLISDSYEPGLTFKVLTASANIEEFYNDNKQPFSLTHIFSSSRYRVINGSKIKCWSTHANGKHANENLSLALNNSCNPIFVDIALSLGKDTFYKYLDAFGYAKCTGIDLTGEAQGMVIPKTSVTDGDLARISFGHSIACTPLQLLVATSVAVNGGYKVTPHLVKEIYDKNSDVSITTEFSKTKTIISEKTSSTIKDYLEKVVSEGSGKQAYIENYRVGGKTGTAQKYENGIINVGKYVMSFIGFFPSDKPKYICLAIVDEPIGGTYGSTVAAPIVKNVFESIIKVKNL